MEDEARPLTSGSSSSWAPPRYSVPRGNRRALFGIVLVASP